jgi:phenylpropionate dioxygenase-like ring-hydroxylating dioxygenase large terminal subunit
MFINFWYPALKSADLTDKPRQVRMLGLDFVLYRDSNGTAHVMSNVCVHRGGCLANGLVKGDNVQCPYHGWQFNGEGRCVRIPSMGKEQKIPARAKIDSYPTVEKYGLIFAFLGDLPEEERPPIMDIPEYGQPGWRATLQEFQFNYDYKRSVENGLDVAHNEFVHPTHGFSGEREDYKLLERTPIIREWASGISNKRYAPPLADPKMREASGRNENAMVEGSTGHHAVNCVWTLIHPTPTMAIHQYGFKSPIDDTKSRSWLVNLRNFLLEPEHDARMMERNQVVGFQDRDILEAMQPHVTPVTNTKELFVDGDQPIGRYRQFLKDWEARGWRIDVRKLIADEGRVAYAIPSPERRKSKGWVIDAVPLLPAARAQVQAQAAE